VKVIVYYIINYHSPPWDACKQTNKKWNFTEKKFKFFFWGYACKKFRGLGPLVWEEIDPAQTVVNPKLKFLYRCRTTILYYTLLGIATKNNSAMNAIIIPFLLSYHQQTGYLAKQSNIIIICEKHTEEISLLGGQNLYSHAAFSYCHAAGD
jgi:hypothetical protein